MTSQPHVTVFGSLHYDIMVVSTDRPRKGETVNGQAWYPKCGGKGGNQAVSCAKSGVSTAMIAAIAQDSFGHALLANLEKKGVNCHHVRQNSDQRTGMSVAIFDAEGDYGAVIVSGSNTTLCNADVENAKEIIEKTSILVLQNEVPDIANVSAARMLRKKNGGYTILNAAPARKLSIELTSLIDLVVVNAIEAELLAGVPVVDTLQGAKEAAQKLIQIFPEAVVTVGSEGLAYAHKSGACLTIPAIKINVASTHGAGDEFIGVLAAELARKTSMENALNKANQAAATLVSIPENKRT